MIDPQLFTDSAINKYITSSGYESIVLGDVETTPIGPEYLEIFDQGKIHVVKSVYISGGMSGYEDHNFPAFNAAAEKFRKQGLFVYNPAENPIMDSWEAYLCEDLQSVCKADAVVVLPRWRESKGAKLEVFVAQNLKKPVLDLETLKPIKEQTCLEEAMRLVNGPRQKNYGPPSKDFARTALIWSAVLQKKLKEGCMIDPQEVGWMMVGVKMSRETNERKPDNLTDAFGYLMCIEKIQRETEIG